MISDGEVPLEKGYYHGVHVLLHFNKEGGVDSKEEQAARLYKPRADQDID